jgi:hypothetical protein
MLSAGLRDDADALKWKADAMAVDQVSLRGVPETAPVERGLLTPRQLR